MDYHAFYQKSTESASSRARASAKAAADALQDIDSGEELDLDRDEPIIDKWRHLRRDRTNAKGNNASGEQAWWMVVCDKIVLREQPNPQANIIARIGRGDVVYCVRTTDSWIAVRPHKKPPPLDTEKPADTWHCKLPEGCPREAWVMWNGAEDKCGGTWLMPVNHLDKLLQYRSTGVSLPREAITWTLSEVDVFLGSVGFVRPGRESAMMRCSKRLVRSVRGGAFGIEFRVDEQGKSGGVFASGPVAKRAWVEVCPLLEVDLKLRMKSNMLTRITLQMVGEKQRYGIVLGFGKVYTVSRTPNLNWSYRGDDEVVLWAAEEIHEGRELTVDFTAAPSPLEQAGKQPPTWQPPEVRKPGKLEKAGYVVHGNSGIHGRGVFTTRDTSAGELIECCPALVLDEAGKEAMFSYRWGLKDQSSDYFLPLGLGSLYNHSEKPTAKGTLDIGRRVLEFYATADMYKGQEVLVSYGDTYFDEDYEGHRKSELLHIESPEADGNLELQKLIEMQRAMIRAFTSDEFMKDVKERADLRMKMVSQQGGGKMLSKDAKTKTVHALFMETEQPILERFGYVTGSKGAFQVQEDLNRATQGLDPSHEAVRNNGILATLTHLYDPPPPEYWETVPLDLVILGTEDLEEPEILQVDVPKKASLGFIRYLISMRFPQTGLFADGSVRLVNGGGRLPYTMLKDHYPLPEPKGEQAGRRGRVLVSGVGDRWPARQKIPRFDGDEEPEELSDWQIVWRWLTDSDAQQSCNNFSGGFYKIAGTWDDFKGNEMLFDGKCFVHWVVMTEQKWESFQILRDGSWDKTLYPDVRDGSPWVAHKLRGPDNKGHGKNWTMGRHNEDAGEAGTAYKVELWPDDKGFPNRVTWTRFPDKEKAAKARLATKAEVDFAAARATSEDLAEAKRRNEESTQLKIEGNEHRTAKTIVVANAMPIAAIAEAMSSQTPVEVKLPSKPREESSLPFDFDWLEEVEDAT